MNPSLLLIFPFLTTAGILLFVPRLAPKRMLFGVHVKPDFRFTEPAQRALRLYQTVVGIVAAAGLAWILSRPDGFGTALFPPLLLSLAGIAAAGWNYNTLRRYRTPPSEMAMAELTTEPDRLPKFFWLFIIPPIVLAGTALYLRLHWADIPVRYPIHWAANGQPNGWSIRSFRGVYGSLIFAGLWMLWFIAMAFASWYGSRRSPLRTAMAQVMLAAEGLFGFLWPCVALLPLYKPNAGLLALLVIGGVLATIIYSISAFSKAGSEAGNEITASAGGKALCYNPNDPSWLLPRADGLGYAPNFAHPVSWMLTLAPFVILLVGRTFLL